MRLASLQEFRSLVFTEASAPSVGTLRDQVKAGRVPGGQRLLGRYYIDLDEFMRISAMKADLNKQHAETAQLDELQGLI